MRMKTKLLEIPKRLWQVARGKVSTLRAKAHQQGEAEVQ
jgi:hypothetical protein